MDILKQNVIEAGRELCRLGLIARTWGNVSVRTEENHFAITASGREYDSLTENEIVTVNLKDLSYEGDIVPSGEKKVHQQIYKLRPDAGFVIHTHQTYASAVSAMGLEQVRLTAGYPGLGMSVPCAEYGLPGSKRVAKGIAKVLRTSDSKAILMSNHGAVCFGRDRDEAFETLLSLEDACRDFLRNAGVVTEKDDDPVKAWPRKKIGVYLDDFAQMFGTHLNLRNYNPQSVADRYGEDVEAVEMVVYKNCLAGLAAVTAGRNPIKMHECLYMRRVYKKKYSKLINMRV